MSFGPIGILDFYNFFFLKTGGDWSPSRISLKKQQLESSLDRQSLHKSDNIYTYLGSLGGAKIDSKTQSILNWRARLSTINLLVLAILDRLLLIMQTFFTFSKYDNLEEVNRTEPSPSVSVPWINCIGCCAAQEATAGAKIGAVAGIFA